MMFVFGGMVKEYCEIIGCSEYLYGLFEWYLELILIYCYLDYFIQYLGYVDLVEDYYGEWWVVFFGVCLIEDGYSVFGCEIFFVLVVWNEGWLYIDNNEGIVSLDMMIQCRLMLVFF